MKLRDGEPVKAETIEKLVLEALPEMMECMEGRIPKDDFLAVFNHSLCALGDRMAEFDKDAWRECFALTEPPFSSSAANIIMGVGLTKIARPLRVFDGVIHGGGKYNRLANRRAKQMENAK
ncbi:hypothetical protein N9N82_03095 [Luminiphilus sp.]|nr:hypothetical protein [Luminiphilus sp.]